MPSSEHSKDYLTQSFNNPALQNTIDFAKKQVENGNVDQYEILLKQLSQTTRHKEWQYQYYVRPRAPESDRTFKSADPFKGHQAWGMCLCSLPSFPDLGQFVPGKSLLGPALDVARRGPTVSETQI